MVDRFQEVTELHLWTRLDMEINIEGLKDDRCGWLEVKAPNGLSIQNTFERKFFNGL